MLRATLSFLCRAPIRALRPILSESILARGTYRPHIVAPESWEKEYRSGSWSHLSDLRELGRYSAIVGYFSFLKPRGSVLDVGCGEGILQQKLAPFCYRRYLGIDISETAIATAMKRANDRATFLCADITTFTPSQKFDLIVFNEILYYFAEPRAIIERLAPSLEPDGLMIASIWTGLPGSRRALKIWRMIDAIAEIIDSTTVSNREVWTIKVFRPK